MMKARQWANQSARTGYFLTTLLGLGLLATGCGTPQYFMPDGKQRVETLKIDMTEDHSLVKAEGTRWVLFKWDMGSGTKRVIRGAVDAAATVGQTVGQTMVEARPEETIMEVFQTAREISRIEQARAAFFPTTPVGPLPALP